MRPSKHLDRLGEIAVASDRSMVVAIEPSKLGKHLGITGI
jgi:hypothetical protein